MVSSRKAISLLPPLGLLGAIAGLVALRSWEFAPRPGQSVARDNSLPVVRHETQRPRLPVVLEPVLSERDRILKLAPDQAVRAFLSRVLDKVPLRGETVTGYQFQAWAQDDNPTHEAFALKAIADADPAKLMARIMDVDGYAEHVAHVKVSRSSSRQPGQVRCYQVISVPRVADVQQELIMVDAGTFRGYRVAFWYLLIDETAALDRKDGPRAAFNVGAWLAAPGAVGYALNSWPRREDVNLIQWKTLTRGADLLAKTVVEGNIDGMAEWARNPGDVDPRPK